MRQLAAARSGRAKIPFLEHTPMLGRNARQAYGHRSGTHSPNG
jgi:hypothetical protein